MSAVTSRNRRLRWFIPVESRLAQLWNRTLRRGTDSAELPRDATPAAEASGLSTVRRAAWVVFALEFAAFATWSGLVWRRFALGIDFLYLNQATNQVDHSGLVGTWHIISQHFDAVLLFALAQLVRLPPHGLLLLWAQDLATVGAGLVAFRWVCEMLQNHPERAGIPASWLATLALILLVANPWIWLTPAFDIHLEAFGTIFIVLAARALERGRIRPAIAWIAITLTCGFVAATYVAGLALSALVAGRGGRRAVGLGLLVVGPLAVFALASIGGSGFLIGTYGYLTGLPASDHMTLGRLVLGVVEHPGIALRTLWSARFALIVNLIPAGLLGLFWGWGFGIALTVLIANALQPNAELLVPSYQSLPVYVFVAVGTVMVLSHLCRRAAPWRLAGIGALAGLIALDTLSWGGVWIPRFPGQWLKVSPAAATVLAKVSREIPPKDEVVVSQGVVGRFSSRRNVVAWASVGATIPLATHTVWFVITPEQGIETIPANAQQALVTQLAASRQAQLIVGKQGVWVFRWTPPLGTHFLVPPSGATIGAWTTAGPSGQPQTIGPARDWAVVSNGQNGYVIAGDYWREGLGTYLVTVRVSATGLANIELWNATGRVLLTRFIVTSTNGATTLSFPVTLSHLYPVHGAYHGWGPFEAPVPYVPSGNSLELRVWAPSSTEIWVSSVSLRLRPPAIAAPGKIKTRSGR